MKKIFASLFLISLLAVPVVGFADGPAGVPCEIKHLTAVANYNSDCANNPQSQAACCLIDKILTVGDWIFTALLVIGIIVILLAGFTFLTAAGNPDKVIKARNTLIYALIGIAIGFLAKIIVNVVAAIVG